MHSAMEAIEREQQRVLVVVIHIREGLLRLVKTVMLQNTDMRLLRHSNARKIIKHLLKSVLVPTNLQLHQMVEKVVVRPQW